MQHSSGLCAVTLALLAIGDAPLRAGPPAATALFPAGGGPGQSIEVTAVGSFDAWPVKVWTSEPGLEIEPGAEKGELTVRAAADATPGLRWVRLYDEQGATALLPFEVSVPPSVVEAEPNDEAAKARPVEPFPAVIDGRLAKRGDVDGFAVTLAAGQTLVASLKGRRLGSPMDAVLQVVSPDGFVMRQSDDEIGLDPQLAFEAPAAGTYVVRCFAFPAEPDSTIGFAGGDRFVYRLTLTSGPFLDHTLPLAAPAAAGTTVEAFGWNLPGELRRLPTAPADVPDRVRVWHPAVAQAVELPVTATAAVEPSAADGDAPPLARPATVSGRIDPAGDRDEYRFAAKKGEVWRFRASAAALGSALDPVLRVADGSGRVLAEQDDGGRAGRDAEVRFTAPEDGEYLASVHDSGGRGGLRFFYRLEATEPTSDFALSVAADRFAVAPGKPLSIPVTVTRRDGFDLPVGIVVRGLPEGIEAAPLTAEGPKSDASKGGRGDADASTAANLTLTAKEGVGFSGPITIVGRATRGEGPSERTASVPLAVPGAATDRLWLTISPGAK